MAFCRAKLSRMRRANCGSAGAFMAAKSGEAGPYLTFT
jgi:hypothetical protein